VNSFERARRFIAGKATKLALAVIPIAAITVIALPPAQASGIILDPGGDDACYLLVGLSGSCSVSQAGEVGGDPNANWIQVSSPALTPFDGSLAVGVFGTANGGPAYTGEMIPVSWDFTVDNPDDITDGGAVTWYLDLGIYGNSGCGSGGVCETDALDSGTAAIGSEVTGTDFIAVTAGGEVDGYTIQLDVTDNADDPFTVTVPLGGTIDLNPQSAPVAPEPASFLLAGAGGALLLLRRKKKAL
jgi:hypothetical protein